MLSNIYMYKDVHFVLMHLQRARLCYIGVFPGLTAVGNARTHTHTNTRTHAHSYLVAVKTSKDSAGEGADELRREATLMAQVPTHRNLVALIGVVTSGVPLLLIIAYCEFGSLLSVLKKRKYDRPLTEVERARCALDIARGMAHLVAHHFVHRDLAARNVLVDSQQVCKVADFGLSRATAIGSSSGDSNDNDEDGQGEYYRSHSGVFPVRWTAPEAMQEMKFTTASDVWSFGITLIEIYADGEKPYPGLRNVEVLNAVTVGSRHQRPPLCPVLMYELAVSCWAEDPAARPTFASIMSELESQLPEDSGGDAGAAATAFVTTETHDGYLQPVTGKAGGGSSGSRVLEPTGSRADGVDDDYENEAPVAAAGIASENDEYDMPDGWLEAERARTSVAGAVSGSSDDIEYDMPTGWLDRDVAAARAGREGGGPVTVNVVVNQHHHHQHSNQTLNVLQVGGGEVQRAPTTAVSNVSRGALMAPEANSAVADDDYEMPVSAGSVSVVDQNEESFDGFESVPSTTEHRTAEAFDGFATVNSSSGAAQAGAGTVL